MPNPRTPLQISELQDLTLSGKKVLMRVDFNVPLNEQAQIVDDRRIRASLDSIHYILTHNASLILMSHLGRPKGKHDPRLSLTPCAHALSQLLKIPVKKADDCIGPEVEHLAHSLQPGEILLLENLRFHVGEENPNEDPSFAKKLASLGDVYVNDAFGASHRPHSSIVPITQYFPKKAAAGFLLQKEIAALSTLLLHPKRPFYALIGGAKISSKIAVLNALLEKTDALFVGGAMAFVFLKAKGISIGDSLCEEKYLALVKEFLKRSEQKKVPLFLPCDFVIADAFANEAQRKIVSIEQGIAQGYRGMDIGPQTLKKWEPILKNAATLFWNGPFGVFEFPHFAKGTYAMAELLAHLNAITVAGGGDTVAALDHLHLFSHFTHVSTGGGASLEFIESEGHLVGIDALSNKG